jgi:hypothetical protein
MPTPRASERRGYVGESLRDSRILKAGFNNLPRFIAVDTRVPSPDRTISRGKRHFEACFPGGLDSQRRLRHSESACYFLVPRGSFAALTDQLYPVYIRCQ